MNKKTENLYKELEELVPLYVKYIFLGQILGTKERDIIDRYSGLGFTAEELEAASKEVYAKLVEKEAIPPLPEITEVLPGSNSELITEL
jgi:hypothetical protein